jgi:hypothetical protein
MLAAEAAIVTLGEKYLESWKMLADIGRQELKLLENVNRFLGDPRGLAELCGRIEQSIRRDFDRNRICAIGNWRLSQTESELCALAALHARRNRR